MVGEGCNTLAFEMKMNTTSDSYGFKLDNLDKNGLKGDEKGDIFLFNFTIQDRVFVLLFKATRDNESVLSGTLTLWEKTESGLERLQVGTWDPVPSDGTAHWSVSNNIGFKLTDSTSLLDGSVKLWVSKHYLYSLGLRGSTVECISASTREQGDGTPGDGVDMDKVPDGGCLSWSLKSPIPEFPFGLLLLALPVIAFYLYMRRRSGMSPPTHVNEVVRHSI